MAAVTLAMSGAKGDHKRRNETPTLLNHLMARRWHALHHGMGP
jgi:hypothetical protein